MNHQVVSVKVYAAVFCGLLALTMTTVAISKLDLGEFNFIVDCMRGIAPARRKTLAPRESFVRTDYSLSGPESLQLVHFVNGGVGRRGWRNWDDVEALLAKERAA